MHKTKLPIFFMLLLLTIQSCKPLYLPNPANVPMLSNAGQFNGQFTTGTSVLDAQVAFSPINHLGIIANLSGSAGEINHHILFEGGAGYYANFSGSKAVMDIYGGFGYGNTTAQETSLGTTTTARGKFLRAFIQPSVGISTQAVDLNFCIKGSLVSMNEYVPANSMVFTHSNNFFVEPFFTVKAGWKPIKFITQLGVSLPLKPLQFEYNPFLFNIGLNLMFGRSWSEE